MTGLYVKLDAEYASDDKLIEAGPMAELLYIRGLCFAKRTLLDGKISRSQLTAVGINIPNVTKHAQALVDVGAWTVTMQGWQITTWLKRNKSAATIAAESEAKKASSQQANHERWHVKEGKPNPTCSLCDPNWETKFGPKPDPKSDPPENEVGSDPVSTKTETETEPKAETKPESSARTSPVTEPPLPPTGDDIERDINRLIDAIADARTKAHCRNPATATAYRTKVVSNLNANDRPAIRALFDERPHMRTAIELAAGWFDATRNAS